MPIERRPRAAAPSKYSPTRLLSMLIFAATSVIILGYLFTGKQINDHESSSNSVRKERRNRRTRSKDNNSRSRELNIIKDGMPWTEFLGLPQETIDPSITEAFPFENLNLRQCPEHITNAIKAPMISNSDYQWCRWAVSPNGGNVKVGFSYGTLQAADRDRFEQLNCNVASRARIPTCDDQWGDFQVSSWRNTSISDECRDSGDGNSDGYKKDSSIGKRDGGSSISCYQSQSAAKFCTFTNVLFDFSKMQDSRSNYDYKSRNFRKGFLSSDCTKSHIADYYPIHANSVDPSNTRCDVVFNETVMMYSHDDSKNIGHSMSDSMNAWAMLWLSRRADKAKEITFLNMDALREGHNYDDELTHMHLHYHSNFRRVLKAIDIARLGPHNSYSKVCFKELIMQPNPLLLFTWDGWWQDMKCSFVGPSSLFQRWNLHVRSGYNFFNDYSNEEIDFPTNKMKRILVIDRIYDGEDALYTSRRIQNKTALVSELGLRLGATSGYEVVLQDLAELPFRGQLKLLGESSLIIGIHGAGIASTMHMAIGTKFCCGVIEIFPRGDYSGIKGYGNMARRMGLIYERIDLTPEQSAIEGAIVPVDSLVGLIQKIFHKIDNGGSSCVLPEVIENPYLARG